MCTSKNNIRLQKHLIGTIVSALFCALFAAVYESFSFGVYSYFMLFAFVIPLLGCSLPYSIIVFRNKNKPGIKALRLWNSGIASLTVGSIIQGVIEIYGTTNYLTVIYAISGGILCISGLTVWLISGRQNRIDKTIRSVVYSENDIQRE